MSNPCRFPRPKLIAASIAAAFCGLPLSVFAAPLYYPGGTTPPSSNPYIMLDATYQLPGIAGGSTQDGMTDSATSIYSNASGADMYLQKSDPLNSNNSVFFHTYGYSTAPSYFGARASGEGTFDAYTRSSYHTTVENTSGVAQVGLFSFNVDAGQVGVYGTGTGSADLLLELRVDNSVVAQDRTTILQTSTGVTCTDSDSGILGGYMSCTDAMSNSAFGNNATYFYGFSLAAGGTLTLDYDIIATVGGVFTGGAGCYGYGGGVGATIVDGGEGGNTVGYYGCGSFNAIARSGDPPFSFVSSTLNPQISVTSVPEPGSLALAALALGGLAAARRRKREKQS